MVIADLFITAPTHGRVVRSVMGRVGVSKVLWF